MYSENSPWIKEREATVCTWKFDYNRGFISNMSVSLINDFITLSARQLGNYAEMMRRCGFTGIQVTDICAAWRANGSWESVHDKYKILADECHKRGMKFTVWCWAAEFSGHGWFDPEAVYRNEDPEKPACEDPRVRAVFNKYYDIYADLAPYADRVIAHFFDPGRLKDIESILYFIRLFADKFRAKNPNVKIAVDTWGCPADYPQQLVDAGMKDIMLMELPFLPVWKQEGKRAAFRRGVKDLGCDLGVWGWYTADYEIDQQPLLVVNGRVLKDVYNRVREQGDSILVPSYWSELDSYHILNFFSMYASGHLLIDPEADPDLLLHESAAAITGNNPQNTAALLSVLELIRDARSGDTWESYWWSEPDYVLTHENHENILPRADHAIDALRELIRQEEPADGIPFPITRRQLYSLILPHLYQIRQYAEFCRGMEDVRRAHERGEERAHVQKMLNDLPFDIPEYNTVTGLWGQVEAFVAHKTLAAFCEQNGYRKPDRNPSVKYIHKRRFIDHLIVRQRACKEQLFVRTRFYEDDYIGAAYAAELMDELTAEGVLVKNGNGEYALANYADYLPDISL